MSQMPSQVNQIDPMTPAASQGMSDASTTGRALAQIEAEKSMNRARIDAQEKLQKAEIQAQKENYANLNAARMQQQQSAQTHETQMQGQQQQFGLLMDERDRRAQAALFSYGEQLKQQQMMANVAYLRKAAGEREKHLDEADQIQKDMDGWDGMAGALAGITDPNKGTINTQIVPGFLHDAMQKMGVMMNPTTGELDVTPTGMVGTLVHSRIHDSNAVTYAINKRLKDTVTNTKEWLAEQAGGPIEQWMASYHPSMFGKKIGGERGNFMDIVADQSSSLQSLFPIASIQMKAAKAKFDFNFKPDMARQAAGNVIHGLSKDIAEGLARERVDDPTQNGPFPTGQVAEHIEKLHNILMDLAYSHASNKNPDMTSKLTADAKNEVLEFGKLGVSADRVNNIVTQVGNSMYGMADMVENGIYEQVPTGTDKYGNVEYKYKEATGFKTGTGVDAEKKWRAAVYREISRVKQAWGTLGMSVPRPEAAVHAVQIMTDLAKNQRVQPGQMQEALMKEGIDSGTLQNVVKKYQQTYGEELGAFNQDPNARAAIGPTSDVNEAFKKAGEFQNLREPALSGLRQKRAKNVRRTLSLPEQGQTLEGPALEEMANQMGISREALLEKLANLPGR